LALPAGFDQLSYDPYLAVNPYSNGIMPKTIYLVGNAATLGSGGSKTVAVVGWRSLDGGQTWQGPVVIASSPETSDANRVVDKPHIAVSYHPATRGWIYVGYSDTSGRLVVRRSQNGGVTFSGPYVISSANAQSSHKNTNGLQLLVSPYSGYIYAFWSDYVDDRIYWARSRDHGMTWSSRSVFPNSITPAHFLLNQQAINSIVRAPSFPIARFNWAANRISVVWHECSQSVTGKTVSPCSGSGVHTDVYYSYLDQYGGGGKILVNDDHGLSDQFMPALDFNASGNVLITFYDRRDDPSNVNYRLYRAWINSSGSPYTGNQAVSQFSSFPVSTGDIPPFLGDYHETWMSTYNGMDTWFSSWIGEDAGNADVFISAIQP